MLIQLIQLGLLLKKSLSADANNSNHTKLDRMPMFSALFLGGSGKAWRGEEETGDHVKRGDHVLILWGAV